MNKLIVGPIDGGLKTNVLPFNIDNDTFPKLINAYQWRGRIKRKRGTSILNRLTRFFNSLSTAYTITSTISVNGSGLANLISGFGLQANLNFVPGSISLTDTTSGEIYTDPAKNGILVGSLGSNGTINYATGAVFLSGSAGHSISANFLYYPDLPVMGLKELDLDPSDYPFSVFFDTTYSYLVTRTFPYSIRDVSFYKNPVIDLTAMPGYIPKTTWTPTTWNGLNYQQFWSTNYQGAFWATNGIKVPFNLSNIGMQFKPIVTVVVDAGGPPALATLEITAHGLVVGDFVFINEVITTTGINFQTGYVIVVVDANHVQVEFPKAIIAGNGTGGIAQYLTNRSDVTKDCIRWFDGDPTTGSSTAPVFIRGDGWVNFMPPLSRSNYSITQLPAAQYYLVGARLIQEFKDRLLFIGPVVQTSTGSPIYLPDTVVFSQNGTVYYTASFAGDPTLSTTVYSPLLVPENQTATASSWWEDQTGFGGYITAGIDRPIVSVISNEDVLLLGCKTIQTRLMYTGNDILPFNFYSIDSELSTSSTFSAIDMGYGAITRGDRGFIVTTQREAKRFDLDILDQNFQVDLNFNGAERFTAQRDYVNEWLYFTYRSNQNSNTYPTQTLQYNYRDDSWAIFNETYTTYGQFRKETGLTWATVGQVYATWREWDDPWSAGASTVLAPDVIGGNQQGFVVFRADGTGESESLYIQSISGNTITSPSHCLSAGDYIVISGCLGVTGLNGNIFSVAYPVTTDTFVLNPIATITGTYLGGGLITRMYVPNIQTKQFPASWSIGRKTRIGVQKYLITTTQKSQIQLLIFLSQDSANAYNEGNIVPQTNVVNNSLIYSTTLFTCPESTNLGLTPANINLQMITNSAGVTAQGQIWHRINTSLIGDTIQLGFTMSDAQMRDVNFNNQFSEIEIHGFIIDVFASQILA